MSNINQNMVDRFNEMLQDQESVIRIYKNEGNDYAYRITVLKDPYMKHDPMVYLTEEFYQMLKNYFDSYHVKLTYNNTGTTLWSHS
jgi:hypothetical protein